MTKRVSMIFLCVVCWTLAEEGPFFNELQFQLETLNSGQILGTLSCGYTLPDKLTLRCDSDRLIFLRLSNLRLDSLPSSISLHSQSLKHIFINAGMHTLDGFSSLSNLTYLNLGNNQISSIPKFFSSFSSLIDLQLYSNSLTTLPDELSSLTLLKYLHLGTNKLSLIPEYLSSFTHLTALLLQTNSLSTLPIKLSSLTKLTYLNLGENHLTSIPEYIASFSKLEYLLWFSNSLTTLPDELSSLSLLSYLSLGDNSLSTIPKFFSSFSLLTDLRLYSNSLSSLPDELSSLTLLSYLNLCDNHFSSFPKFISSFTLLTELRLHSNSLLTLPNEFTSLTSLQDLFLQHNLSLQASTDLFKEMRQLTELNVSSTLISGLIPSFENFYCSSTCISYSRCSKNPSCPCSSFFADACPRYCGVNSQQLCVDCSSLVSKQQCSGDCSWCSGNKDGFDCFWCDYSKECSDTSRCNVCSGYSTFDRCEYNGCHWCAYNYCVEKIDACKKVCSNLAESNCSSDLGCSWCSSYAVCLDSTDQCLSCDRFTSSFCPLGCDCSSSSKSSVIIVVCVACCVVFLLICVCLFVLLVLKKKSVTMSNKLHAISHFNSSLRFESDIGMNETSDHLYVSRYSECSVDSLFRVSQPILCFSSSGCPIKLCSPSTVSFEMTNVCGMELVVDCLFVKGFKEKHDFSFSPSSFTIGVNEKQKISVELTMTCSATLSPTQSLICCEISNKQQWCSLCGIQAQSELSPLLSCDDIELKRELGRGAFGKVFLGSFKGTEVAIKVSNGMSIEDFNAEAETLSKLHSPQIVAFFGISQTLNGMIIEYCKYGSVDDYYAKHSLKKEIQTLICFDIARGMKYLHLNGIIHRDLKPANVLISSLSTDLNVSRAKISDFGTSRSSKFTMQMTRGVGTPSFMAPEILDAQEYGRSSDVYAFGMTIWSIFTQKIPFAEESMNSIIVLLSEGKRPPLPSSSCCDFNDLIERCWAQNPHQRPSFEEITEYFQQFLASK